MSENVFLHTYTTCLSALSITVSLENIQNSLNIVLLVLSIINFLVACIPSLVKKIKAVLADKKVTREEWNELSDMMTQITLQMKNIIDTTKVVKAEDEEENEGSNSWDPVNAKNSK